MFVYIYTHAWMNILGHKNCVFWTIIFYMNQRLLINFINYSNNSIFNIFLLVNYYTHCTHIEMLTDEYIWLWIIEENCCLSNENHIVINLLIMGGTFCKKKNIEVKIIKHISYANKELILIILQNSWG